MWYSGYEALSVQPSDVISAAEFAYKQLAAAVTISGLEELQNAGEQRMIDLLSARIRNAEKTMANKISEGLYATGTGNGGKEIGGLQLIIADSPSSGTVGGIDRGNYSFWRNVSYDASTDGGSAVTSTNIQSFMNSLWVQLVRGGDAPDLILSDNIYYKAYLASLQTIQRITNDKMAQAGFVNLNANDNGEIALAA